MDNKKTYVLLLMALLVLAAMGTYFTLVQKEIEKNRIIKKETTADEKKFKKEYEDLNGKKDEDEEYKSVTIDTNNLMKYASSDEILELLTSGTGIIYFGYPECPWCRNAVPVLIETAKEEKVKQIYYYNAKEDRDIKEEKDGNITTKKEGTPFYNKLLELLGDQASVYEELNDESVKRLYFPTVIFVKEGKIQLIHESTVDSQKDPLVSLNDKEKTELKNKYIEGITAVYGDVCDEKC